MWLTGDIAFFWLSLYCLSCVITCNDLFLNLPENHLSRYFNEFKSIKEKCISDRNCKHNDFLLSSRYNANLCWGYEDWCDLNNIISRPTCKVGGKQWIDTKKREDIFFDQADFGYIRQQRREMTLVCEPKLKTDSSLECTKHLRFCRGRNILMNFTHLMDFKEPFRYKTDVLKEGHISGYCEVNKTQIILESDHFGALQSWAPELKFFDKLNYRPLNAVGKCDLIVNRPTFIMKIDAASNMYHHFCDFLNLYASLHVNSTIRSEVFSKDVQILIWETYPYFSSFSETFKAFSENPVWTLNNVKGKVVCFKNLVLPLLPRMIFGLYYNTPLVSGCEKSGLFQAFSEFVLHRLGITAEWKPFKQIRITFLVRRTKYRRVLNENELVMEMNKNKKYLVRAVSFEGVSFVDQLKIISNTDVFVGMHGAGLTHLLFLPIWATVFELYNCEDPNCYKDLSRLRGVNYITWEDENKIFPEDEGHHPEGGAHAKFTNYVFDVKEFSRLVNKAAYLVLSHEDYNKAVSRINNQPSKRTYSDEL